VENIYLTGNNDLDVQGNWQNNIISSNDGNNYLTGYLGDDTYIFNDNWGNDVISDNYGISNIDLSSVTKDIHYDVDTRDQSTGLVDFVSDNNTLTILAPWWGFDTKTIRLGSGNDIINVGGGGIDDIIYSGKGNDEVYAGAGDDIIHAGSGDDIVEGGEGNDIIYSSGGSDLLIYSNNSGQDEIINFYSGLDKFSIQSDINGTGVETATDMVLRTIIDREADQALIDLGDGNTITLAIPDWHSIDENNFIITS
jgi:Ca2+-binding RTX toxin-like protein